MRTTTLGTAFVLLALGALSVLLVVAFGIRVLIRARRLWAKASDAHRNERMPLSVFCGRWSRRTCVNVPRAYMSLFACFERRHAGLIFEAVQVMVWRQGDAPSARYTVLGTRAPAKRKNGWLFDIGACGMVAKGETPLRAAERELDEELGITTGVFVGDPMRLVFVGTYYPGVGHRGYSCIIHCYEIEVPEDTNLESKDGTFSEIEWVPEVEYLTVAAGKCGHAHGSAVRGLFRPDLVHMMDERERRGASERSGTRLA